jgi:hypothetical protein
MQANACEGQPGAPGRAAAPAALESGQGVKEVRIDLSGLHEVLGAPKWSAAEILRRLLAAWGAKGRVVELRIPPGPHPYEVVEREVAKSDETAQRAIAKVVLHDGHQTATAIVLDVFDKSDTSPVTKIYVKPDGFGSYEVVRVTGRLKILDELERRGVLPIVSADLLETYLDRLRGEATAPQLELLLRHREAIEFLESITEEDEA